MRRVCYVSGTRADFGLMASTLERARDSGSLDVSVCVTGMHLLAQYGETVREIEAAGLRIVGRIPVQLDGTTGAVMARAVGHELIGMVDVFEAERPDLVLLLGDRGEMLAGAVAALHLNIPVAHIHGGERSGTVDEPVRHAISKLAHYHFVATPGARERLERMGEAPERIHVTGAPGLDGLAAAATISREELCRRMGLDARRSVALVLFHAVLQEAAQARDQIAAVVDAVTGAGLQALCFMPNSDAGGQAVQQELDIRAAMSADVQLAHHVPREEYVSWLAAADLMVGNSSSGIIEAATFGLPVVNVGSRQQGRERSANVRNAEPTCAAVAAAVEAARRRGRVACENVYGDGQAGVRIVKLLSSLPLDAAVLKKINAY